MMTPTYRSIRPGPDGIRSLLEQEWLVTNGLGGYASGTVGGTATRRFHGYLIAALPAPRGRVMYFNQLTEAFAGTNGSIVSLSAGSGVRAPSSVLRNPPLTEFRLEMGLPVWVYEFENIRLEKRLVIPHLQNTVCISWSLLDGNGKTALNLRPAFNFRPHEGFLADFSAAPYRVTVTENRYEIIANVDLPSLKWVLDGRESRFVPDERVSQDNYYAMENDRGYDSLGVLWSPGHFTACLAPGDSVTLITSCEDWHVAMSATPAEIYQVEVARRNRLLLAAAPEVRTSIGAELVLAADQFIISPIGRASVTGDFAPHAYSRGNNPPCTVIAGYPWFTDWGRDTMISLEGLTLTTGRFNEARGILHLFAHSIRDGLIPNLFPEGKNEGLYHTADATLWFFHAFDRYVEMTNDRQTLKSVLPKMVDIVNHHLSGTRFNIHVDPMDGLLIQGAPGYQLTWMDAKVGDWVVTPRRGKAVEINALWYNALRLVEGWLRIDGQVEAAQQLSNHAERARVSFNQRFWYALGHHLYDVIDGENGDDNACRPNQILSISLRHPILNQERWTSVMTTVTEQLLTPVGLRTLAPLHVDYRAAYHGDVRARDAAYHQGTVWPWLMGPFIDAWLRAYPDERQAARRFLQGFDGHLNFACVGSISEIFDAEPPFHPRGCIAQAWSVAEALRCWRLTA